MRKSLQYAACLMLVSLALIALNGWRSSTRQPVSSRTTLAKPRMELAPLPAPEFVGRASCAPCHEEQDRLWQGSHHDLAMQEATDTTVLGDFDSAVFRKNDVESRFFRRDGRFLVRTDGPDGRLADFFIRYTFGITPLQQYLIELPGGRLQALSIAWDSRPREQGGQRWFHLYPDEPVDYTDPLHWTKPSQNWNDRCAECHSTNLRKNYDPTTRTYATTWSEIDVACEACHGPGSLHVAFERREPGFERIEAGTKGLVIQLNERRGISWVVGPRSGNARRSSPRLQAREIETCARCHALRGRWFADDRGGEPFLSTYLPALLQEGLYQVDGQIKGEVYEYGSFLQSRMYRAGVTCSDCHEPHSLRLRATGNGLCLQCHAAEKYESEKHHFHRLGSKGSECVGCHMPAKRYMVIDERRDHSFRIPRPDLSEKLGTSNACTDCHGEKPASWAAAKVRQWYGHTPSGFQAYAEALHSARHKAVNAEESLVALLQNTGQPAIARATAAMELRRVLTPSSLPVLIKALQDSDPLVRIGALQGLEALPVEQRWQAAHHLLRDPLRVVRALSAQALAEMSNEQIPDSERTDWLQASEEYLASLRLNADEPNALVNLGNFYTARGNYAAAKTAYRTALILDPDWVAAYVNLSDLYRVIGRDTEGEILLREGLRRRPQAASLHHSLGLLLVRKKKLAEALISLKQAMVLAPDDTRFCYVYAVALYSAGRVAEAQAIIEAGLKQAPGDPGLSELRVQLAD